MVKPEVYRSLGLKDEEYRKILRILGREPSPTELAMFSVEWSEHCGYPRSRNWLKLLPKKGKYETLIGEDSGGIIVDDLAIIFKMESHNHPSQVEPRQGAATGVGGIIRDIFTAGARPIALLDSLRFGPLSKSYNRYLLRGVVDGIQFYGNCLGVPTVAGEIYFDESYNGNCLVNAMSIGIAKRNKLVRARAFGVGNSIIYVGSSTGKDGIGGCSVLASHEFKEGEEKRPTVQIGDPFTEKCLIEATLEALNTGHVVGIKDMGAAGLTCSTSEMASAG
ncbi:MAG: AIR synthase related protein, partial [Omnitrophica bacterium]|nr:AIR synthase related protein [Candidatus Omnitrophota bacterium]